MFRYPGRTPVELPRKGLHLSYRVIVHNGEMNVGGYRKIIQGVLSSDRQQLLTNQLIFFDIINVFLKSFFQKNKRNDAIA